MRFKQLITAAEEQRHSELHKGRKTVSSHEGRQAAQVVQFLLTAGETEAWRDSTELMVTQGGCY